MSKCNNCLIRLFFLFFVMTPLLLISENYIPEKTDKALKPSVCLNMIVKNESHIITRCLETVVPLIDTWIIVDTGSNDGTQQIIKDFMQEHQIPGELHERPWVNFGHNREEALMLAKNKADYLLFIDADDILSYPPNFELPNLIHDVYLVKSRDSGIQRCVWVFVKASLDWHWHDPIHEYIKVKDAADESLEGAILNNIDYHSIKDGARSKKNNKTVEDLQIVKKALEQNPANKRLTYYLAQLYMNSNNLHKALEYFQKRIDLGGYPQEVFSAMLYMAKVQQRLNHKPEAIAATYRKAMHFRPSRPEPYYYLALQARLAGQFQKAYEIAKAGLDLPASTDIAEIEYKTYDGLLLERAYCALELGKHAECKRICQRLQNKIDVSPEYRENIKVIMGLLKNKQQSQGALKVINKFYGDTL